jgi:drug/metabolite transporter (DMT)-like permease
MQAWVAIAVGAALLQNLRSALQKTLTAEAGLLGATYARFLFAAPWAVGLATALALERGVIPRPTAAFLAWGLFGALSQIVATLLLLAVFTRRNFAVGNTFAKTEAVQAAVFGLVLLGDRLSGLAVAGMAASLAGIVLISVRAVPGTALVGRAALLGLASGAAFALSAVAYRGATLALEGAPGALVAPSFTLACVTLVQTLALTLWLGLREPEAIVAVLRRWPTAALVGAAGMLASLGWFVAFTLATAAEVKAVGQVELLFSWLTARYGFGELPSVRETLGILLVAGGIVLVVLAG